MRSIKQHNGIRFRIWLINILTGVFMINSFSSCTLTKRRYHKGFHVDWFQSGEKKSRRDQTSKTVLNFPDQLSTVNLLHQLPCDTIRLLSGDTILAERVEMTDKKVEYAICNSGDSLKSSVNKTRVEFIKYETGPKVTLNEPIEIDDDFDAQVAMNQANASLIVSGVNLVVFFVAPVLGIVLSLLALSLALAAYFRAPKNRSVKLKRRIVLAATLSVLPLAVFLTILAWLMSTL